MDGVASMLSISVTAGLIALVVTLAAARHRGHCPRGSDSAVERA
jgi:hypothetical protein